MLLAAGDHDLSHDPHFLLGEEVSVMAIRIDGIDMEEVKTVTVNGEEVMVFKKDWSTFDWSKTDEYRIKKVLADSTARALA